MAKITKLAYNFLVKLFLIYLIPITIFAQNHSKLFAPGTIDSLQVYNFLGPITVKASTQARVTVHKHDFVPACHLKTKLVDRMIFIKATKEEKLFSWADAKSCRVEIILEMPANLVMYFKSKRGDISVKGMTGDITFDIEYGNATIGGKIQNLTGVVKSGNIVVTGATENVSLKTYSGDIKVRYQKSPFSAELDLISNRGDIDLFLPEGTKIAGNWKAPNGKLINDFKAHKASLFNLHLEAVRGNLSIKKIAK